MKSEERMTHLRTSYLRTSYASALLTPLLMLTACGGAGDANVGPSLVTKNQGAAAGASSEDGALDDPENASPPAEGEPCSDLSEDACLATRGCTPIYGGACPAIWCDPTSGQECPPCQDSDEFFACVREPPEPPQPPPCPADHCVALSETACLAEPTCEPMYAVTDSVCVCDAPDGVECPPCDAGTAPSTFAGCVAKDPCVMLDEAACNAAPNCHAYYGGVCPDIACDPNGSCPRCDADSSFFGCSSIVTCAPAPSEPEPVPADPGSSGGEDNIPEPGL